MIRFWGKIKLGQKRGKALGFPTANINLNKKVDQGIYISLVKLNQKIYPALTFIGENITFGEKIFQAESYILDFNQDIYNSWISVKLLEKIRGNQKFASVSDLIIAMKDDQKKAREYFSKK
ncbi:hypothetical protein HY025_00790 [Candidatus Daviesbacteria bacterium]|nr:hypothetical protein [Candidatus Daviesbacteria bacterium]